MDTLSTTITTFGGIVVSLIGMVGSVAAAWLSFHAKRQAAQANDAVNHRHPESPRLYDSVLSTERDVRELLRWRDQHERRWGTLDESINNAQRLSDKLHGIDVALRRNDETHERIIGMIESK